MMTAITVYKRDHQGNPVWQYEGIVLAREAYCIQLEARFNRPDHVTPYHVFRQGDRMIEWFYTDRWYNIFQMHDVDDDHLKGWYCNITRPARFEDNAIYADDLALDLMVYPDGRTLVLDEDEFADLPLDPLTEEHALAVLADLKRMADHAEGIFHLIQR